MAVEEEQLASYKNQFEKGEQSMLTFIFMPIKLIGDFTNKSFN